MGNAVREMIGAGTGMHKCDAALGGVRKNIPQGLNRLRKNSISQKGRKIDRVRMPQERSVKVG
jgi:translation elongation factor EF-Ts